MAAGLNLHHYKVGKRIGAGFALLLLLAVVTVIGMIGIFHGEDGLSTYDKVADNSIFTMTISQDYATLRRNVVRFALTGDDKAKAKAEKLRGEVESFLSNMKAA